MFRPKSGGSGMIQHPAARSGTSFLQSGLQRLKVYPLSACGEHDGFREGGRLGLVVGMATWIWVVLVDAISGSPFPTITALGGVLAFTLGHFGLNLAYGISLVSLIHGSRRYPSLILVALIGFAMIEIGFIMLTAVLSVFLGGIAWLSILGGTVIGTAIAFALLLQTHPLAALLNAAETER